MDKPKNTCEICGNKEFTNHEGFFFCVECGTQAQNVQEIALEDEFVDGVYAKRQKIIEDKQDAVQITSWECMNYILIGIVNELQNLGAKDDLKLKTFYVWAEYLRRNDIAFFKTNKNSMPKLSASFKAKDAKVIYNHRLPPKRRKSKTSSVASSSTRWTTRRRKFANAVYEKTLNESSDFSLTSFFNSTRLSSSDKTESSIGIKLTFTDSARKTLKKVVHPKHLERHENDFEKSMECRCLPLKKEKVLYRKRTGELFNRKTLFSLIYVALNLIYDKIQLYDLFRFLRNGNVSSRNFKEFFPENIQDICVKTLSGHDFRRCFDLTLNSIRRQSAVVCKTLRIKRLNTPDISNIIVRLCKDFMLPNDFVTYVERLVNFYPPQMEYIGEMTPFYEGRAVAYIIFIMKLLFGLDDIKEKIISESAKTINKILTYKKEYKQVFVFTEWIEYIQMRKIILSRYNLCYCDMYKDFKNLDAALNALNISDDNEDDKQNFGLNRNNIFNMHAIFGTFLGERKRSQPFCNTKFISFTPQLDYFERIIYDPPEDVIITDKHKFDHSLTEIEPFIETKKFKEFLKSKNIDLHIIEIACNSNTLLVEPFSNKPKRAKEKRGILQKIVFSESENNVQENHSQLLCENYLKLIEAECLKPVNKSNTKQGKIKKQKKKDNQNVHPVQLILNPIDDEDNFDFVDDSESENDINETSDEDCNTEKEKCKFSISNMDYWILHGRIDIKSDFAYVKTQLPKNFLWLIETFAQYLESDVEDIYHELMVLENQYIYILEDIDKMKNCILFKNIDKDDKQAQFAEYFAKFW